MACPGLLSFPRYADATVERLQAHLRAVAARYPRAWAEPLVSLLLYLCSEAAEIRDTRGSSRASHRPHPVATNCGPKEIPAATPTTWEVGWRIDAALRLAAEHEETGYSAGPHTGPRAHLRRAHWHAYCTGHRQADRPGEQLVLRWLHPILVGAGGVVPTVHEVE